MRKLALLIGVSEYEAGLNPLPSAVRDVDALKEVLEDSEIGEFDVVKVLKNPDRQDMEVKIEEFLTDSQRDDLLLLYFSGHGIVDDAGNFYLSSKSTHLHQNRLRTATAVKAKDIHGWMSNCKAKRQVVILDCCNAGAFIKGLTAKDVGRIDIRAQLGGEGRAILAAATSTQYAFEQEGLDLSIYTHYLVEGLKTGTADEDGDGLISVNELQDYVSLRVREKAPSMTPKIYPLMQDTKPIVIARSHHRINNSTTAQTESDTTQCVNIPLKAAPHSLSRRRFIQQASFVGVGIGATVGASAWLRSLSSSQSSSARPSQTPELITTASSADIQSFVEELEDGLMLEMIQIPGGKFKMGSLPTEPGHRSEEGPQHEVTITKFAMGKHPITQAQWRSVANLPAVNRDLNPFPAYFQNPDHPVEQISWLDAVEFCVRLSQKTGRSYRLPTEAEWEYACRAGTTTSYYFGDTLTQELANYDSKATTPVGSFTANAFGLHDMHGNVWECCADYWRRNYEGAPLNGSARSDPNLNYARVIRGGSWASEALQCRSAKRIWYVESTTLNFVFKPSEFGMRVACSI